MMTTDGLSMETMAGQRLMLGFDGVSFNDDLKYIIGELNAGGIILFARNIESPDQVCRLLNDCRDYAASCNLPPLFIAVDQEGGAVARLKPPFTQFKGNPSIVSAEDARYFAAVTADELKQAGFNMNLAPVLDWAPDGTDSIMKDRMFRGGIDHVSKLGMQVIKTLQQNRIMAVAKHFPGIGRTVKDSHYHLPVLDIAPDTLREWDMAPFRDAVDLDVAGIMLSHIFYPALDADWQASLSPAVARDLLRTELGYGGLVMTDDLDMKAVQKDMATCVAQIMKAGIDMALICHKGPNIDIARQQVLHLLDTDETLHEQGRVAVARILKYKKEYLEQASGRNESEG